MDTAKDTSLMLLEALSAHHSGEMEHVSEKWNPGNPDVGSDIGIQPTGNGSVETSYM